MGLPSLDGVSRHIDFNRRIGQPSMSDKKLRELIIHFNKVPLRQHDFGFPDLLGAAYDYRIRDFADSAGSQGGEFYTPRKVTYNTLADIRAAAGAGANNWGACRW